MPDAASNGITDMWMCVIVGRTSESSLPSSSVRRVSISSYSTGLPSSRDQLGWVPHSSRYAGIASMISRSRSKPR